MTLCPLLYLLGAEKTIFPGRFTDFLQGGIRMDPVYYTVKQISGDYALLLSDEGVEHTVAMALLPPETDEGVRLCWEAFAYRVL